MGTHEGNSKSEGLVKVCNLWLKEQSNSTIKRPSATKKFPESTQITFNCSEALVVAP